MNAHNFKAYVPGPPLPRRQGSDHTIYPSVHNGKKEPHRPPTSISSGARADVHIERARLKRVGAKD